MKIAWILSEEEGKILINSLIKRGNLIRKERLLVNQFCETFGYVFRSDGDRGVRLVKPV